MTIGGDVVVSSAIARVDEEVSRRINEKISFPFKIPNVFLWTKALI